MLSADGGLAGLTSREFHQRHPYLHMGSTARTTKQGSLNHLGHKPLRRPR